METANKQTTTKIWLENSEKKRKKNAFTSDRTFHRTNHAHFIHAIRKRRKLPHRFIHLMFWSDGSQCCAVPTRFPKICVVCDTFLVYDLWYARRNICVCSLRWRRMCDVCTYIFLFFSISYPLGLRTNEAGWITLYRLIYTYTYIRSPLIFRSRSRNSSSYRSFTPQQWIHTLCYVLCLAHTVFILFYSTLLFVALNFIIYEFCSSVTRRFYVYSINTHSVCCVHERFSLRPHIYKLERTRSEMKFWFHFFA